MQDIRRACSKGGETAYHSMYGESARPSARGQTLVETIIALTILVVGMLGLLSLLTRSLALNNFVSQEYIGAYLASEGVEIIKGLIDHNVQSGGPWNAGLLAGEYEIDYKAISSAEKVPFFLPGYPLRLNQDGFYSYDLVFVVGGVRRGQGGTATPFRRKITIREFGGTRLNVKSLVWWKGPFGAQEVELENEFYAP